MQTVPQLFGRLADIGRGSAAVPAEPVTLYDRHGVLVVRVGDVVVKAHQPGREYGAALAARIRLAAALPHVLLAPSGPPLDVDGRTVTVTPYGEPVDPATELPWPEGGRLLAELHACPVPADAPSWGRPTRIARLVSRLADGPAEEEIRRAFATLPPWIRGTAQEPPGPRHLIHGDWHLGQMIRIADGWRLLDIEDLGAGDPAWDLARPAALYLAGVLHPDEWTAFTTAYTEAGGPIGGDLWAALDVPARSLAIQIAATCVISARGEDRPLDGPEQAMVDACSRISRTGAA